MIELFLISFRPGAHLALRVALDQTANFTPAPAGDLDFA
jgi:hypothetical protein